MVRCIGLLRGESDLIVTASPAIDTESAPSGERSAVIAVARALTD